MDGTQEKHTGTYYWDATRGRGSAAVIARKACAVTFALEICRLPHFSSLGCALFIGQANQGDRL